MPGSRPTVELDLPLGGIAPDRIRPMLPMAAAEPFDSPQHLFEVAWDGVRSMARRDSSGVRLWGRALRDLTGQFPEAQVLSGLLPPDTIVDGELIVGDHDGRPDPGALAEREHADRAATVERLAARHPVTFVIYDLVALRGRSLLREPLQRRRGLLKEIVGSTGRVYVPEPIPAEGIAFYDAAREKGLEGIVAKRLDGRYHPGRRHPDWLLVQAVRREDFVVLGFGPGRGDHLLQALVVGSFDGHGFRPVARVEGGFDADTAVRLRRVLDGLPAGAPAANERWSQDGIAWVEPRAVVCVRFSEWDARGQLRFPIFSGLRPDVAPEECVRTPLLEPPAPARPRRVDIQLPTLPI
jgi:bifunctional non-homologous end joining protein LigD